jgi:hypothetical protein
VTPVIGTTTPGDFGPQFVALDAHEVDALSAGNRLTRCGVHMGDDFQAVWRWLADRSYQA